MTPRNRVHRLGIELEGGWTREQVLAHGAEITHDASVQGLPDGCYRGEIPSPPLGIEQWEAWVRKHYPQHSNASCGLHVHMSFRSPLTYQRLMCQAYETALLGGISRWAAGLLPPGHHLWGRLHGENRYCRSAFLADQQARVRNKSQSRYTIVNYCYQLHQTLEVRVLPMFQDLDTRDPISMAVTRHVPGVDLAVAAIQTLISATNAFLLTQKWKERPLLTATPADDLAPVCEEYHVTV
jgi:hypothetical protein